MQAIGLKNAGHHDAAAELLDEVLATFPDDILALIAKGEVQIHRSQIDEGIETLREVLERRPDMGATAQNVARVCRRTGRHEEALQCYEMIVRASISQVKCYFQASLICSRLGRHDEALEWIDRLEQNVELNAEQAEEARERRAEIARQRQRD